MKVDLTMWAKNGAKFLPLVLRRIDQVIPRKSVNKKVFVDDHSTDSTVEIAERYGWKIYENERGGVNEGANTALSHVTTPFFVSIEQDVILSREWWERIPPYMKDPQVGIAQGIRLPTNHILRGIEDYVYKRKDILGQRILSIDNNIYRTKLIRKFGGFHPSPKDFCPRFGLTGKQNGIKYKWIVDRNVISDHIRDTVREHGLHMHKMHFKFMKKKYFPITPVLRIFLLSPLRAFDIMLKEQCPEAIFCYPYLRFMVLKGIIDRRKMKRHDEIFVNNLNRLDT